MSEADNLMSEADNYDNHQKKRSLILAGGGVKVAFQAGVLQVWLDEAGITFDHVDGASGGTFNLSMYCQGMSGTQIANNWRNLPVSLYADFNWKEYTKLFYADSILKLDRFREQVFPGWGLDWDKIRTSKHEATFNVYNFSKHELEALTPDMMTEDYLIACSSLPMWFPPVIIHEDIYIDAVFITDANIEEAIRRGADEIWVVWTVSEKSEWNPGFIANYFQIIEASANGHFRRMVQRIEENNAALTAGKAGEFGRHIDLRILRAEVPLHYLINISTDRIKEAVNLGVQRARQWCMEQGIELSHLSEPYQADFTTLTFSEEMKGFIAFGETDYYSGFKHGSTSGTFLMAHLSVKVNGIDRFITEPEHVASVEGYIECEKLGGNLLVEKGVFNLIVSEGDPTSKKMLYRLYFCDETGCPWTLSGCKLIRDDHRFDILNDTTTLFTRILRGHVGSEDEAHAEIVASGIIRIHFLDFLKQLATFRVEAQNDFDKAAVLARFGVFFLGKLWDVYAQQVLSYGPF